MRNNIKFSASVFIIILSIMFGFITYAEKTSESVNCPDYVQLCPDGVTYVGPVGPKCELKACPNQKGERELFKKETEDKVRENKLQKEEVKNEFKSAREGIKEVQKNKLESMLQNIKEKRAMLKTQIEANKEETKIKVEAAKNNLQLGLAKIKNEGKKISTENIVNTIQKLNAKMTETLNDKIDKLENVLVSIDSRISKAEDKDIDVTNVKLEVLKAKESIDKARVIVAEQAKKVYEVNITSEANLKTDMKTLRDTFVKDIKTVRDSVKSVDQRVHDIAVSLAKVPKINEDKIETEDTTPVVVEDDNTTQNN